MSIKSRKHSSARYLAVLAAATAVPVFVPMMAQADMAADMGTDTGDGVTVVDVYGHHQSFKAEASSPKFTQPLVDTPQTVTVVTKAVLDDQGATTLMEALRNTPGITLQMGENGNTSAGDTFQMRGFDGSGSLYVDGVRDLGAVSRDIFNIEQIEIVKGPGGADSGRSASGGYINQVSKRANLSQVRTATLSAYSAGGGRATADANMVIDDDSALRINAMVQQQDVAGRDVVEKSGYGLAVAYGKGLGTNTRVHVLAQYLNADNVPDGGISTIGRDGFYNANAAVRDGAPIERENFYGSIHDYEKNEATQGTLILEHRFANDFYLTNTTRVGSAELDRVLTGVNAITAVDPANPSTWTLSRSRQRVLTQNSVAANTTNVRGTASAFGVSHDLAFGVELSTERKKSYGFSGATTPAANLYAPDPYVVLPVNALNGQYAAIRVDTAAAYLFDTVHFSDSFLITGGVRVDSYKVESRLTNGHQVEGDGTLASYKIGAVYKPTEQSSLYLSWGNSKTPPGTGNLSAPTTTFGGSESPSSVNSPNMDPQETDNIEAGAKWDLFEGRLSLTGAYYYTLHKNELTEDTFGSGVFTQYGERKVEGLEFGAVGRITPNWSIIAGLQTMKTEVIEGSATGNSSEGASARWSPELSATVWTTYRINERFTVGGGARYTGEQLRVVNPATDPATQNMPSLPEFWVVDAMASYAVTPRVAVQLNLYNIGDEDYISVLNNGGSRMSLGAPFTATLSAKLSF